MRNFFALFSRRTQLLDDERKVSPTRSIPWCGHAMRNVRFQQSSVIILCCRCPWATIYLTSDGGHLTSDGLVCSFALIVVKQILKAKIIIIKFKEKCEI